MRFFCNMQIMNRTTDKNISVAFSPMLMVNKLYYYNLHSFRSLHYVLNITVKTAYNGTAKDQNIFPL